MHSIGLGCLSPPFPVLFLKNRFYYVFWWRYKTQQYWQEWLAELSSWGPFGLCADLCPVMLCTFHHSFFSPNVLPGLSLSPGKCTIAAHLLTRCSPFCLEISYNIWLLYHQQYVISHHLQSWVLFVLVGVMLSMKEIGGFFRQFLNAFKTWNRTLFLLHPVRWKALTAAIESWVDMQLYK